MKGKWTIALVLGLIFLYAFGKAFSALTLNPSTSGLIFGIIAVIIAGFLISRRK